jgi:hypothetical protein
MNPESKPYYKKKNQKTKNLSDPEQNVGRNIGSK